MSQPEYAMVIYDQKIKERFLEVTDEKTYNREAIFAYQAFQNSTALQKCSKESIRNAIVNIALTGVSLNPSLQEAYIIPRKGKAVLDFSYRGLIGIACSKGNVKSMNAQVVYTWDDFEFEQGTRPFIHYKMNLNPPEDIDEISKDPKRIWNYVVCAFSTATLLDGSIDFVVLPKYKLWKIYQTSEGKDNEKMPWSTWPEEQIRKTVIKYHSKTLPKQGNDRLATAVSILNEHEGLDKTTKAETLLKKFDDKKDVIEMITCPETTEERPKTDCLECASKELCKVAA